MGLYWWSALYFGRLINASTFAKLRNHPLIQVNPQLLEKQLTKAVNVNGETMWFFHGPGMIETVGSMNPVMEPKDIATGLVQWTDASSRIAAVVQGWQNIDTEELKTFNKLVKDVLLNEDSEADTIKPDFFACQCTWSTLEGNDSSCYLEHNFKVVNVPFQPKQEL